MRDTPTSRRQVRQICRCRHCQPASRLRLSRHACADRPWSKHVMMMGNRPSVTMVTITFADVDMNNTVCLRT